MGETDEDIVDLARDLRGLGPDSVPINFLIPIDGTPLMGRFELTPQRCLRILALFAVRPRAVLLDNPGGQPGRGVVQTIAEGLGTGLLQGFIGALVSLPPALLLKVTALSLCGRRILFGYRAVHVGDMDADQGFGKELSEARSNAAAEVASVGAKNARSSGAA